MPVADDEDQQQIKERRLAQTNSTIVNINSRGKTTRKIINEVVFLILIDILFDPFSCSNGTLKFPLCYSYYTIFMC